MNEIKDNVTHVDNNQQILIDYLPEDIHLANLVGEWFFDEWGSQHPGATLEKYQEKMQSLANSTKIPLTLIAYIGSTPVGTVSLVECDMESRSELSPWATGLFVLPDYRGYGVGAALCKRIAEEASHLGREFVYMYTEDRLHLYHGLGCKSIEETRHLEKDVTILKFGINL